MSTINKLLSNQKRIGSDGDWLLELYDDRNKPIFSINGYLLTATVIGTDGITVADVAVVTNTEGEARPVINITPAQVAVVGSVILILKGTNKASDAVEFDIQVEIVDFT
jgi:hypothetical protein